MKKHYEILISRKLRLRNREAIYQFVEQIVVAITSRSAIETRQGYTESSKKISLRSAIFIFSL